MRRYLNLIPLVVFAVACVLPAFQAVATGQTHLKGYACLFFGALGFLDQRRCFLAWLANPLFFGAAGFAWARKSGWAIVLAVAAVGLSLSMFGIATLPADESGRRLDVRLGLGAYVWLASLVSLVLTQTVIVILQRKNPSRLDALVQRTK